MNRSQTNKSRTRNFSDVIPVLHIEDGLALIRDGTAAMGFEIVGNEVEQMDKGRIEGFNQALASAVGDLEAGIIIQKMDAHFERSCQSSDQETGYYNAKQSRHFSTRLVHMHRAHIFVGLGPEGSSANPYSNAYTGYGLKKDPFVGIQERMAKVRQMGRVLADRLDAFGIELKPLDNEELKQVFLDYFNLEFDPAHATTGLHHQLSPLENGLAVGDKHVRMVSLYKQGAFVAHTTKTQKVDQPFVHPIAHDLKTPHVVVTTIRVEDQEKVLKSLDRDQKMSRALKRAGSQDDAIRAQEYLVFTEKVRTENLPLVSLNLSLILYESSAEKVAKSVQLTLAGFQKMAGCQGLVENMDTTVLFFANAPGNGGQNYRWRLMPAEQAMAYMHFTKPYLSDQEGILMTDRAGNPLLVQLFNPNTDNRNGIVTGQAGSGKSFFVSLLITMRFGKGDIQVIIDNGGTYAHLMKALGGRYFNYDPQNPLSLNPFYVRIAADGSYRLSAEKLTFLVALLATIWKKGEISQIERSVLIKLIPDYYRSLTSESFPSLAGFAGWLKAYDEAHLGEADYEKLRANFSVDTLLLVLEPFVTGEYKDLFAYTENLDISDLKLIAFDVQRIKENRVLYPIISLIITELAMEQIRRYPNLRKIIYMDEAWSMLSDTMGGFVEHMYRTVRKNHGAIYIITQGVNEIIHSDFGEAILKNSSNKIVLPHTDQTQIKHLGEVLGLTRHELDKVHSLRKLPQGREVFIKQDDYGKVYLVEVAPELAAVFSSTPEERNRLSALIAEKGGNVKHALQQLMEDQLLKSYE